MWEVPGGRGGYGGGSQRGFRGAEGEAAAMPKGCQVPQRSRPTAAPPALPFPPHPVPAGPAQRRRQHGGGAELPPLPVTGPRPVLVPVPRPEPGLLAGPCPPPEPHTGSVRAFYCLTGSPWSRRAPAAPKHRCPPPPQPHFAPASGRGSRLPPRGPCPQLLREGPGRGLRGHSEREEG